MPTTPLSLALPAAAFAALALGATTAAGVVATNPSPVCTGATCTISFPAVGDHYAWTVPALTSALSLDVQGAQGGTANTSTPTPGGAGARVQATMPAVAGTQLFIYPGGQGASGSTTAAGGWNGGGLGRDPRGYNFNRYGGGGGASDIRTTAGVLASRVIVAGGGGGAAGFNTGRRVGGAGGQSGTAGETSGPYGLPGGGATPSSGGAGGNGGSAYAGGDGALGVGGNGNGCTIADGCDGTNGYSYGGSGGGGGLFGGGGGGGFGYPPGAGGGGSSGIAAPVTGPTYTTGFRTGAGLVVISYTQYEVPAFSASSPGLTATVGTPYSYAFAATGVPAPALATTGTLPPGLVFDPATGTLSGTPTAAGAFEFAVTATNLASTVTTTTFRLQVDPQPSSAGQTGSASPATTGSTTTGNSAGAVASARGERRVTRNGRRATVVQDVRLSLDGRYTFIFVRTDGSRIPLSPGSRISARPTARTTTAPVRVVTGPDPLVRVSALMGAAAASDARLRVIRRAPDGALTGATLG